MKLDKAIMEQLTNLEAQLEELETYFRRAVTDTVAYRKASYTYSKLIEERNRIMESFGLKAVV